MMELRLFYSCLGIFVLFCIIPYVFCSIKTSGNVIKNVGQDVVLMWNTTNGSSITEATWGLLGSDGNSIAPKFIYIRSWGDGQPVLSDSLNTTAIRYKGRVSWVGDLSAGHAWYKMTNLTLQDTNQYAAEIIEQGESEASKPHPTVNLTVYTDPPTTTASSATTNITTSSSSLPTSTATPSPIFTTAPPPKGLSKGAIAGIAIGSILGCILGGIIGWFIYKKCFKKSQPANPPADKKQDTEMNSPSAVKA